MTPPALDRGNSVRRPPILNGTHVVRRALRVLRLPANNLCERATKSDWSEHRSACTCRIGRRRKPPSESGAIIPAARWPGIHLEREIKDAAVQCYTVAIDRHRQSMISSHFARWLCPECLDACSYLGASISASVRRCAAHCGDAGFLAMEGARWTGIAGGAIAPLALFGVKADFHPAALSLDLSEAYVREAKHYLKHCPR
jgi:hypothetical protein